MPSILIIISQMEMERMKTRYLYVYPKILYNIRASDWRGNGYYALLLKAHMNEKEHFQSSVRHVQAILIINKNSHDGSERPC